MNRLELDLIERFPQFRTRIEEECLSCYITIADPISIIPLKNKVSVVIFLNESSIIQAAKKLRKEIAANPYKHGYSRNTKPFKPSILSWAIFARAEDKIPTINSVNWNEETLVGGI